MLWIFPGFSYYSWLISVPKLPDAKEMPEIDKPAKLMRIR